MLPNNARGMRGMLTYTRAALQRSGMPQTSSSCQLYSSCTVPASFRKLNICYYIRAPLCARPIRNRMEGLGIS